MTEALVPVLARHEQIPARAGAAAQVLELVDDPDTSAQQVARALGADPGFAATVLRVANSSYYGLSGRVATLPYAVSVVGFQAIRTFAVIAAAGLDDAAAVPQGFWASATLCATACEIVAPVVGADAGDAFSAGLLHTLGAALLHQERPPAMLCLPYPDSRDDLDGLLAAEQAEHGICHDELAATVLQRWHFPVHICEAIGRHHQPVLPDAVPLDRALQLGRVVANVVLCDGEIEVDDALVAWLSEGRIGAGAVEPLLDRVAVKAQALLAGLRAGR